MQKYQYFEWGSTLNLDGFKIIIFQYIICEPFRYWKEGLTKPDANLWEIWRKFKCRRSMFYPLHLCQGGRAKFTCCIFTTCTRMYGMRWFWPHRELLILISVTSGLIVNIRRYFCVHFYNFDSCFLFLFCLFVFVAVVVFACGCVVVGFFCLPVCLFVLFLFLFILFLFFLMKNKKFVDFWVDLVATKY